MRQSPNNSDFRLHDYFGQKSSKRCALVVCCVWQVVCWACTNPSIGVAYPGGVRLVSTASHRLAVLRSGLLIESDFPADLFVCRYSPTGRGYHEEDERDYMKIASGNESFYGQHPSHQGHLFWTWSENKRIRHQNEDELFTCVPGARKQLTQKGLMHQLQVVSGICPSLGGPTSRVASHIHSSTAILASTWPECIL
ncbi:unnamed protein product [Protopolystoma xenopodis]|uniref:Uncharacterized protein n=1 Tax=Protopolystoma xenopodis TaxID=117903 RepID=A0A3S4ZZD5_9PLAT|nr:unnamed protein product [Protopolystoma xenopodis]